MSTSSHDLAAAHRHFSVSCFNGVWELIDKPDRSPDDDRKMVSMCHASLYHWQQRPDCTPRSLSIGYWQLSRVYALLEQADSAWQYGWLCLTHSQNEEPFYLGYAYEALARADFLAGNRLRADERLELAREQAAKVAGADEREMLQKDLKFMKVVPNLALPSLTKDELDALRQSVIAEIHEAFAQVSREGGVSWSESKVHDDYGGPEECAKAQRSDKDTHWAQLVDDPAWDAASGVGGFAFLDPIGFRYYLAAALARVVGKVHDVPDLNFWLASQLRTHHSLLDDRQRRCIARCLLFMAREEEASCPGDGEGLMSLLDKGWRRYLNE